LGEHEGVFCYVNSVFAPGLDEGVGNLWRVSFLFPFFFAEGDSIIVFCCVARRRSLMFFKTVFQDGGGVGGELQCYAGVWMNGGGVLYCCRHERGMLYMFLRIIRMLT
jgi:hypothetical protein